MTLLHFVDLIFNILLTSSITVLFYYCLTPKYNFIISMLPNTTISITHYIIFSIILNQSYLIVIKNIIVFAYFLLYTILLYKDNLKRKISIIIFSQLIMLIIDLFAAAIISVIFGLENIIESIPIRILAFIIELCLVSIFYPIFIHFFNKFTKKENMPHFGSFILFLINQIIFILIASFMIALYIDNSYKNALTENKLKIFYTIVAILSVICIITAIISDIILYRVQKENSNNKKLKESLELANYRNELELQYYQQIQTNIEETRKIRHDFYNILSAMNDANKISSELKDEIETALRNSSTATLCQNNIVNLIILNKNKTCLENNIKLDTDLDIPEEISISKLDLLRVFGNILDNAIEANSKITNNNNRFIKLNAKICDNYLFISAKNPFDFELIKNEKHYETTKKQKNLHGFGMTILDDIAKKYNGELITENNENNFTTLISLKIS